MPGDPFNVRVFGYRLRQVSLTQRRQFTGDTFFVPEEPPVWSQVAVSNGVEPVVVSFTGTGPDNAQVIGIEIPEGKAIRYELQPFGAQGRNARVPSAESRLMKAGFDYMEWSGGSSFAFVDAVDLP